MSMADLGARVVVRGNSGTVRYVGTTQFKPGTWVGVELDLPLGKNNGSVQGVAYFACAPNHGLFVQPGLVKPESQKAHQSNPVPELRSEPPVTFTSPTSPVPSTPSPRRQPALSHSPSRTSTMRHSSVAARALSLHSPPDLRPDMPSEVRVASRVSERSFTARSPSSTPELATRLYVMKRPDRMGPQSDDRMSMGPHEINSDNHSGNLNRELESVKTKLRIIERKRLEDRDKILGLQQETKRAARLETIVNRLQSKLAPMHEEIVALRAKLSDRDSVVSSLSLQVESAEDAMSMAVVDREMAEEHSESLQMDLNELKAKFEQLELECQILSEENDLLKLDKDEGMSGDATDSKMLAARSDKLEQALIRMRDVYSELEASSKAELADLHKQVASFKAVESKLQQTELKLVEAETIIHDLQIQLDNALGAEQMIEDLTEKNLELSEKCQELEAVVEELETLKELSDELEANHTEREHHLISQVQALEVANADYTKKAAELDERNSYLESVIVKFRDLVASLDAELTSLKATKSDTVKDRTKAISDLNLNISSSSVVKTLELELRRFDSVQAIRHLELVKHYLPEEYSRDAPSLECLMTLERIMFETQSIEAYFQDLVAQVDVELYTDICLSLLAARGSAYYLEQLMIHSDSDAFREFERFLADLKAVDRMFAGALEELKKERLVEVEFARIAAAAVTKIARVREMVDHDIKGLFRVFDGNKLMHVRRYADLVTRLLNTFEVLVGKDHELYTTVARALSPVSRAKVLSTRLLNEVNEKADKYKARFYMPNQEFDAVVRLEDVMQSLARFLAAVVESGLQGDVSEAVIESAGSKLLKSDHGVPFMAALKEYADRLGELRQVSMKSEASMDVPREPWVRMAQKLKAERGMLQDREQELERLREQSQQMALAVRQKEKRLEDLEVTVSTLRNRLVGSKSREEQLESLRINVETSRRANEELEQRLAKLHESLQARDEELARLRKTSAIASVRIDADDLSSARVPGLESAVKRLLRAQDDAHYKGMLNCDWMLPIATGPGRNRSLVQTKLHGVFRQIQVAVQSHEPIEMRVPQKTVWHSRQASARMQVLAQKEMLEHIRAAVRRHIY